MLQLASSFSTADLRRIRPKNSATMIQRSNDPTMRSIDPTVLLDTAIDPTDDEEWTMKHATHEACYDKTEEEDRKLHGARRPLEERHPLLRMPKGLKNQSASIRWNPMKPNDTKQHHHTDEEEDEERGADSPTRWRRNKEDDRTKKKHQTKNEALAAR